jgi:hypothetical protein
MRLQISVLAQDLPRENFWMSELRAALHGVHDVELSAVSSGIVPGTVVFIDGASDAALAQLPSRLSTFDRKGRAVCLIISEKSPIPRALLDGEVDDVLVHPFRNIEVMAKLYLFQRILQWNEVGQVSAGFTDLMTHLREDLELATRLQKHRHPRRFPDVRGVQVASRYLAGLKPGGDHFDLAESRDGTNLSLLLSDSSSHGLSSAVLSALMTVALKLSADEVRSTRETVRRIFSEVLVALSERDHLSLFYGIINRKDWRLRFLNIGHSRIFHAARDGLFRDLGSQGEAITRSRMLGEPEEQEIQLEPSDRLVLLSDGFVEAAGGPEEARLLLDRFRGKESLDALNEFTFQVKSRLSTPDDLPAQDCTAIVLDVDAKVLRLTRL